MTFKVAPPRARRSEDEGECAVSCLPKATAQSQDAFTAGSAKLFPDKSHCVEDIYKTRYCCESLRSWIEQAAAPNAHPTDPVS